MTAVGTVALISLLNVEKLVMLLLVSAPDELKANPGHLIAIVQHPTKSSKVMSRCIAHCSVL